MFGNVERDGAHTGMSATPIAFLSYDAALLVARSIAAAGLNRMKIRDELTRVSYEGIIGKTEFNSLRGSLKEPVMLTFRDGRWEPVND
jgi:ABC-type branched-subunit amino acid transport system substrate-binding protein